MLDALKEQDTERAETIKTTVHGIFNDMQFKWDILSQVG